jgi:hypothetical protein
MPAISTDPGELSLETPAPIVGKDIAAYLPETVLEELLRLPEAKQAAFVAAFHNQSRSLGFAYLTSLIYCHYGLLGRWAMTGLMWSSLFLTSALGAAIGLIWWLIDLVRLPGMVRSHNHQVALAILRQLTATPDPAALPGS